MPASADTDSARFSPPPEGMLVASSALRIEMACSIASSFWPRASSLAKDMGNSKEREQRWWREDIAIPRRDFTMHEKRRGAANGDVAAPLDPARAKLGECAGRGELSASSFSPCGRRCPKGG